MPTDSESEDEFYDRAGPTGVGYGVGYPAEYADEDEEQDEEDARRQEDFEDSNEGNGLPSRLLSKYSDEDSKEEEEDEEEEEEEDEVEDEVDDEEDSLDDEEGEVADYTTGFPANAFARSPNRFILRGTSFADSMGSVRFQPLQRPQTATGGRFTHTNRSEVCVPFLSFSLFLDPLSSVMTANVCLSGGRAAWQCPRLVP